MKFLVLSIMLFGCANLERDLDEGTRPPEGEFSDAGVELPPRPDAPVSPPDSSPPPDSTPPPDVCEPECRCDDDCGHGFRCQNDRCYKRCDCDDDCSGPGNQSCDHGLCKGH